MEITSYLSRINPFSKKVDNKKNDKVSIECGSENFLINGIRNISSVFGKITFWSLTINSGHLSDKTIKMTRKYLIDNNLQDVKVSVNQYKPQMIWERTFSNPKTSFLAKLFLGGINCLGYTFSITKLTGFPSMAADSYDPFSNTITLYSDNPSIALQECAISKDFNSRKYPSLYALVPFYPRLLASSNVLEYLRKSNYSSDDIKDAKKVLLPRSIIPILIPIASLGLYLYNNRLTRDGNISLALCISVICGHIIGHVSTNFE